MRQASKGNLANPCPTCKSPEGRPCKAPSKAYPDSERNTGHVHGSRARVAGYA